VVTSRKTPTTQPDPSGGIQAALDQLEPDLLLNVSMVSLATTFATNAIVEDRGAEAGLILIGYDDLPPDIPNTTRVLKIEGGHTVNGSEKTPLDAAVLDKALDKFIQGLDAVAIAAFFSVRNPQHEIRAAQIIRDRYQLPVVRGHRLSMRLDAFKRATTVWWNARLIPLISDLIKATGDVLAAKKINVPLMVVRGDGTLMSARTALDRPVDTLLSGPAASILGARHLSGLTDALIVDMGGTTTDLAYLSGSKVAIDPRGAKVGKWRTHVEAARVRTVGVGGDSLIALTPGRNLKVGPRRAVPLCVMALQSPEIVDMLKAVLKVVDKAPCGRVNPCSFYFQTGEGWQDGDKGSQSGNMGSSPSNEYLQFKDTCNWFSASEMERQERKGLVFRSSLTPTDIRVAAGHFELGVREAGRLGLAVFAQHMGVAQADFIQAVEEEISRKLCLETVSLLGNKSGSALVQLIDHWFHPSFHPWDEVGLDVSVSLPAPVIGVGAPAAQCLPKTFDRLHAKCLLPESYEVSVAVGAVVGMVDYTVTALIRADESGHFILHSEDGRAEFNTRKEALENGRRKLEALARSRMKTDHVAEPLLDFSVEEKSVKTGGGEDIYLEILLRLRATGRPNVGQPS
jgi:N-methylhydantoinase A/oxoprolinase/acetone carboxylase beta subunit